MVLVCWIYPVYWRCQAGILFETLSCDRLDTSHDITVPEGVCDSARSALVQDGCGGTGVHIIYPMASVEISGERECLELLDLPTPSDLILMGHGIKARTHTH